MISNEEKIAVIINRLNNLDLSIKSLVDNADVNINKYSLEEELALCEAKKNALLEALQNLGGSWPEVLTNQN